jgi:hypothetical protein
MPNTLRTEESIFAEALDKSSGEERAAFLDGACSDDPGSRETIELPGPPIGSPSSDTNEAALF